MNISPFRLGVRMATINRTVFPVWFEAYDVGKLAAVRQAYAAFAVGGQILGTTYETVIVRKRNGILNASTTNRGRY